MDEPKTLGDYQFKGGNLCIRITLLILAMVVCLSIVGVITYVYVPGDDAVIVYQRTVIILMLTAMALIPIFVPMMDHTTTMRYPFTDVLLNLMTCCYTPFIASRLHNRKARANQNIALKETLSKISSALAGHISPQTDPEKARYITSLLHDPKFREIFELAQNLQMKIPRLRQLLSSTQSQPLMGNEITQTLEVFAQYKELLCEVLRLHKRHPKLAKQRNSVSAGLARPNPDEVRITMPDSSSSSSSASSGGYKPPPPVNWGKQEEDSERTPLLFNNRLPEEGNP